MKAKVLRSKVHHVESSHLVSIQYSRKYHVLVVAFRDGSIYRFEEVPEYRFLGLLHPDRANLTHGRYFASYIRYEFPYQRIDPERRTS